MSYKTFAAINVGSYELAMKIFEISAHKGIKEIDCVRHRIELGTDSYFTGKISGERVDELCRVLREFTRTMKAYRADAYKAYGTSAMREVENSLILLDMIENRTGIKIEVLGNSEQRFLDYKSVASKGRVFQAVIEKSTAFIDIGGGSIQISLFDKDSLVTTQNIRPGVLRMREELAKIPYKSYQLEQMVEEMVYDRILGFKEMYAKGRKIQNIILVDDYVSLILQRNYLNTNKKGHVNTEKFLGFVDTLKKKKAREIALSLGIAEENTQLLQLSALMVKHMVKVFGAEMLWAPGVSLCDGMAYEYAETSGLLGYETQDKAAAHNFEQDILACARDINRRYHSSEKRTADRERSALLLFDSMKGVHGLSGRDRLMLQLSAILSECGRYISLANMGESSYNIVMATEVIGLSHIEREIVANTVRYFTEPFEYYEKLGTVSMVDRESYLRIVKLTAILRLAEAVDINHRGKCERMDASVNDDELIIMIETDADMTMEKALFGKNSSFFEEVFNIKPVIRHKRKT